MKVPSFNTIFWMAVIGFVAALFAIKASNNIDLLEQATDQ